MKTIPHPLRAIAAAYLAMEEINNSTTILPNYNLDIVWKDGGCSSPMSLANITDLWKEE